MKKDMKEKVEKKNQEGSWSKLKRMVKEMATYTWRGRHRRQGHTC